MVYIKNNNTIKQNNNKNKKYKFKNKVKKLTQKQNKNQTQNQKGGSSNKKERFEVHSFDDFDYSQISVAKYINANIDWGTCPGIPPKPDCTIL